MALPTVFAGLTTAQMSALDNNFNALGNIDYVPCTAVGTNTITLTPVANAPAISAYTQMQGYSMVAVATNSTTVNVQVGALALLPAYKPSASGPAALANSDIQGTEYYVFVYDSALNSNNGGFHTLNVMFGTTPQNANLVYAGPSAGASAQPTFRSLTNADLPLPLTTAIGGVMAFNSALSQVVVAIASSGQPQARQLAFTDISGSIATTQLPSQLVETSITTGTAASFNILTGGGPQFQVSNTSGSTTWVVVTGSAGGSPFISTSQGNLTLGAQSAVGLILDTANTTYLGGSSTTNMAAKAQPVSNSVNFVTMNGAATGGGPLVTADGTDTPGIPLNVSSAGSGAINFKTGGGTQAVVTNTSGVARTVQFTGSVSGNPTVSASGGSLALNPAGAVAFASSGAVNASGQFTFPKQPAFSALLSSTQNNVTGDGTQYTVLFDTILLNQAAGYSAGSGNFTAPIDGVYAFQSQLDWTSFTSQHSPMYLRIVTSSKTFEFVAPKYTADANGQAGLQASCACFMSANDTCHIVAVAFNSGKNVGVFGSATADTFFSGFKVA